ncbi:MAG: hypothetical protein JJE30_02010 [Desulfuromonadales bacterium]|nr:hypothetical protein [Desulfuromonadales bacterium]
MDFDDEVSVKDIVSFYIKINDPVKAKKDLSQLSSKDKASAFDIITASSGSREFKIEVAKYFLYDLDTRVRKKAEFMMESLVPDWVSDPAESILRLLKSGDHKGAARHNAAVRFLFGIVDSASLRGTFMTLLSSRNRSHMAEIMVILEEYIDASVDEHEQVKIFDACLDIILSDDADNNMKHYASTLLSVFFKKVQTTELGAALRQKYVEKQIEKADGVYRYLCSGTSGLNATFLEDLLRPLTGGGSSYQIKILNYFNYVMDKIRRTDDIDSILDIYPDYWNQDEPAKEDKLNALCRRINAAVDELWSYTEDAEVRGLIVRIRYGEYVNKRELLEQIRFKIEGEEPLTGPAREKIALMLHCFLLPDEDETLKLLVSHLLLFKLGGVENQIPALGYLQYYVENKSLNYAEKGSIAAVVDALLKDPDLAADIRETARYILFIAAPDRFTIEDDQRDILNYLRKIVEGKGFGYEEAEMRVVQSLIILSDKLLKNEKFKKAAKYLEFKIRNPENRLNMARIKGKK